MNNVSLVGNLTRDPAYFESENGLIAKFDIATKVGFDTEKNEERVEFVPITAFGVSEAFKAYLKKGRTISIYGRVGTDSYEKDGTKIYTTTVKAFNGNIRLVGANPKKDEAPAA